MQSGLLKVDASSDPAQLAKKIGSEKSASFSSAVQNREETLPNSFLLSKSLDLGRSGDL
jgi:hypothetical protein